MTTEYVHKPYDNIIILELTEDGENLTQAQYDSITRMTLDFHGTVVDSSVVGSGGGEPFDWSGDRQLVLDLGKLASESPAITIASKAYPRVKHVVYSPGNPNGLVWGYLRVVVN